MKTQKDAVLRYLQKHKSITATEAAMELGVWRLSSVIYDLRADGHRIRTRITNTETSRYRKTGRARYYLRK